MLTASRASLANRSGRPSYCASVVVRCGGGDASGERGERGGEPAGESRFSSAHFLSAGLERGLRWILRLAADIIDDTMSRVVTSLPGIELLIYLWNGF